jgi:glyoxylase-like metal-dependent hydrolase (beta-lactamase superfamily II)
MHIHVQHTGHTYMTRLPASPHFSLHELGEGIYAVLHAPGGWAQSNAGIIDLGDRTLVYDAFLSPLATRDLLAAAQALTGRPARLVLNSHYHNDHTWGNLGVPVDTDILSTFKTHQILAERDPREYQDYHEQALRSLGEMQVLLERATGESEKAHAQYFVVYYQAILDTLPRLPPRLANILTQDVLEFTGPKRRARFIPLGGHTASDAILHLPDDNLLFLSDLLFVQAHPYLGDGHPDGLRQAAAQIKALHAEVLVPGHGPLGKTRDVDVMLEYVNELQEMVQQAIRDEVNWEALARRPIPDKYSTWIFPNFYAENVQFLYQFCSAT